MAWVLQANQEAASTLERPIRKAKKSVSYVLHIGKRKQEESYFETRATDMHSNLQNTHRPYFQAPSTMFFFFRQMKWALKMIDAFWRVLPTIRSCKVSKVCNLFTLWMHCKWVEISEDSVTQESLRCLRLWHLIYEGMLIEILQRSKYSQVSTFAGVLKRKRKSIVY